MDENQEESCLVCANCSVTIAVDTTIIRDRASLTLSSAVYPYELEDLLGAPAWCYSATTPDGHRFDVICTGATAADHASRPSRRSSKTSSGPTTTKMGAFLADAKAFPSEEHSWFPGFSWQAVYCANCPSPQHLGWSYAASSSGLVDSMLGAPTTFFALILTRLRERQQLKHGSNVQSNAARGLGCMPASLLPSTGAPSRARRSLSTPSQYAADPDSESSGSSGAEEEAFRQQRRSMRAGRFSAPSVAQQGSVDTSDGLMRRRKAPGASFRAARRTAPAPVMARQRLPDLLAADSTRSYRGRQSSTHRS